MRWSLRQIEVFIAVLEEGGFSAAGERLGMVQPAVSIAVRKLEENAGVRLLDRSGSRVQSTHEGALFLNHARMIRAEIVSMERQLRELRSLDAGHIKIAAPPIASAVLLPGLAKEFLAAHPGVRVSTIEDSSENIAARLRARDLDLGIIAGAHDTAGLDVVLVEQHPIVAWTSAQSPLARETELDWKRILEEPLILFPAGYNQRSLVDDMAAKLGKKPDVRVESKSQGFLSEMVASGRGLLVAFAGMGRDFDSNVKIPITGNPAVPFWLCRREGLAPGLAANAFFDRVAARFAKAV